MKLFTKHCFGINIKSFLELSLIFYHYFTYFKDLIRIIKRQIMLIKELIRKCSDFMARNLDLTNCVTVLR